MFEVTSISPSGFRFNRTLPAKAAQHYIDILCGHGFIIARLRWFAG